MKGRGNYLPPPRPFLDPLETSNDRTCPPIGLGEAAAHFKDVVRSAPDLPRRIRQIQSFAAFALLCLLVSQPGVLGAEQNKRGREIFRQLCVKCHGRNGEGVKGKYDDALRGDWPIEKLTRYIDKSMPDDAPDKCVGPDAETVARYIYDAFYSREARLRNHPPRVELVRLTNRQYLNTVADLIKHFTGNDATTGGERGLRASYYSLRQSFVESGFNVKKLLVDIVTTSALHGTEKPGRGS